MLVLTMLEEEEDFDKWRIHWVAALATIRTVGYVLDKVDGAQNPNIKKVSNTLFKEWKSDSKKHGIFTEFIEKDRNLILKEYSSNLHPFSEIPMAVEYTTNDPSNKVHEVFELDHTIYHPFRDGPYEGIDARDVYKEAIEWWAAQLDKIERDI